MLLRLGVAIGLLSCSFLSLAQEYWIDVRIPEQFEHEHLADAINLPLNQLVREIGQVAKNKDDVIHLYCNTGGQSSIAKVVLQRKGYTQVIDEGGLQAIKIRMAEQSK